MPPPNTPEEGLAGSHSSLALPESTPGGVGVPSNNEASRASPGILDIVFDVRNLEYDGPIDENLICPICRMPFVDPVMTTCGHVFCRDCLGQACETSPACPVDRGRLRYPDDLVVVPRIVRNQLDSLRVNCPNQPCGTSTSRDKMQNHVSRYCALSLVPCSDKNCAKKTKRADLDKGCLHYPDKCAYCNKAVERARMEEHCQEECVDNMIECGECGVEVVCHTLDSHQASCPEIRSHCDYGEAGCTFEAKRKDLGGHHETCIYKAIAKLNLAVAEDKQEIRDLKSKVRSYERRMRWLESTPVPVSSSLGDDLSDLALGMPSDRGSMPDGPAPYEARDQYFLSLFETMESRFEDLRKNITEIDGRQSVMLLNETMPIKEQLAEIRSTLGVLGMHVRWLMNFRIQERSRLVSGGSNMSAGDPGVNDTSGSSAPSARRTSDTLRENPARL